MHESERPYLLGCFRVLSLVCHSFFVVKQMPSLYNELDNLTTGGVSAEVMKDPEAPPLPLLFNSGTEKTQPRAPDHDGYVVRENFGY